MQGWKEINASHQLKKAREKNNQKIELSIKILKDIDVCNFLDDSFRI
jgi:hypothetical protein